MHTSLRASIQMDCSHLYQEHFERFQSRRDQFWTDGALTEAYTGGEASLLGFFSTDYTKET